MLHRLVLPKVLLPLLRPLAGSSLMAHSARARYPTPLPVARQVLPALKA